jgi:hypothetical protein
MLCLIAPGGCAFNIALAVDDRICFSFTIPFDHYFIKYFV